jgi:hypothetical protein
MVEGHGLVISILFWTISDTVDYIGIHPFRLCAVKLLAQTRKMHPNEKRYS